LSRYPHIFTWNSHYNKKKLVFLDLSQGKQVVRNLLTAYKGLFIFGSKCICQTMPFRAFKLRADLDVVEITSFGEEVISENWLKKQKN
jgi:hypothetical protein